MQGVPPRVDRDALLRHNGLSDKVEKDPPTGPLAEDLALISERVLSIQAMVSKNVTVFRDFVTPR